MYMQRHMYTEIYVYKCWISPVFFSRCQLYKCGRACLPYPLQKTPFYFSQLQTPPTSSVESAECSRPQARCNPEIPRA